MSLVFTIGEAFADATIGTGPPVSWASTAPVRAEVPALAIQPIGGAARLDIGASSPPAGVTEEIVMRRSLVMPTPTLVDGRPAQPWAPSSVVEEEWGVIRVFGESHDRTFAVSGHQLRPIRWDRSEPFGAGPAEFFLGGVTSLSDLASDPATSWIKRGAAMDVVRMGGPAFQELLWSGEIDTLSPTLTGLRIQCIGAIWTADLQHHRPLPYLPPRDIGYVIPRTLNYIQRRFQWIPDVVTGIETTQRGTSNDTRLGYAQQLLATFGTTDDGTGQWTIAQEHVTSWRQFRMRLKDRSTVHLHITPGTHGVDCDGLQLIGTGAPNVIMGRGIDSEGRRWANWHYPNAPGSSSLPAYPFASPSTNMTIGTTDGDTTSGEGVSTWQQRMVELGYRLTVDGVFNAADSSVARQVQRRLGISVTGIVDPQTWTTSFAAASVPSDALDAVRLPLAWDPAVEPYLYNADGSIAGDNPAYDFKALRIEREEDFGDGITKGEGIRSARAEFARDSEPGWAGTIVLATDPEEMSRFAVYEGMNVMVRGLGGRSPGVLMHISGTSVDLGPGAGRVTLTVDEKARDMVTLAGILQRDREAAKDPARRPGNPAKRSTLSPDAVAEWDYESPAGIVPRHAQNAGTWQVLPIAMSKTGRIVRADFRTSPAAKYVIALFGAGIRAADLVRYVGDPLRTISSGAGPFDTNADILEGQFAWIEAWGQHGQACGYYPGTESTSAPLTGRFVDSGGADFVIAKPPRAYVAIWCDRDCFISGRFYPAPVDA